MESPDSTAGLLGIRAPASTPSLCKYGSGAFYSQVMTRDLKDRPQHPAQERTRPGVRGMKIRVTPWPTHAFPRASCFSSAERSSESASRVGEGAVQSRVPDEG